MTRAELRHHLSDVLAGLRFPLQRWEILTAAELHGVDQRTLGRLRRLREPRYVALAVVIEELATDKTSDPWSWTR